MVGKGTLSLEQQVTQNQRQQQRLIMLPQMQQAIQILQIPVMELASMIEVEMERNPILEYSHERDCSDEVGDAAAHEQEIVDYRQASDVQSEQEVRVDDENFDVLRQLDEAYRDHFAQSEPYGGQGSREEEEQRLNYLESLITDEETLQDQLTAQAREAFADPAHLQMAEVLLGYLDANGFASTSLDEIAALHQFHTSDLEQILKVLQTFEPAGICARTLQESLLIQLERSGRKEGLAYRIVDQCYDDMLHNRIPAISRRLHATSGEISTALNHVIARLTFHPGSHARFSAPQQITADAVIRQEGDELIVEANEEPIPQFHINRRYLRMLDDPTLPLETAEFIKQKITAARWLMRTIQQRNSTVVAIAKSLVVRQAAFFKSPEGQLTPLTMKALSDELELHESTIARAVSQKYIDTPRGILPLRFFFTSSLETDEGADISSNTARDEMRRILDEENKKRPLSDESIARMLSEKGIKCARRTVAKYRLELGVGNAQQRRQY